MRAVYSLGLIQELTALKVHLPDLQFTSTTLLAFKPLPALTIY